MSEDNKIPFSDCHLAWDYVVGKLSSLCMTPAEVLHVLMSYGTRTDYNEILKEIKEDLKDRDDLSDEVKEHLSTESVGEFFEFDHWMWAKKIDKKYEKAADLFLKYKVESVGAKDLVVLGLYVEEKVSLSKAAELFNLPLATFIDYLSERGIPVVRYTEEMLEQDLKGVEESLAKRAELPLKEYVKIGDDEKQEILNYVQEKKVPSLDEIENACKKYSENAKEFFNTHGYDLDQDELAKELLKLCKEKLDKKSDENE